MASLGELFIELGVLGDVKGLEKFAQKAKELEEQYEKVSRAVQKQIQWDEKLEAIEKKIARAQNYVKQATDAETKTKAQQTLSIFENRKAQLLEAKSAEEQAEKQAGIIKSTEKLIAGKKALAGKIAGVVKRIGVFIGAVTAAAIAMNKLTNELVQSNQAMLNLTRTTDIAQSTFQKWGGIGKMLGVENADQQLAGLNQRLFELMLTGEGARGFQLAGINPIGQDAEGVLEQLRNRINGLSDTSASYLLQQMGLDPQMLHLLRMSREEFEALGETIRKYQLTPEQSQQIQEMNMQLQIASIKMKYFKDKAVLALMPYWVKFVQSVANIAEGLSKLVDYISSLTIGSVKLTTVIKTALIPALFGIGVAIAPVQTAIVGLLSTLYLIADDVAHYFNGGGSILGVIINFFDEINNKINAIDTPQWIKDLLILVHNGGNLVSTLNDLQKSRNGEEVKVTPGKAFSTIAPFLPGIGGFIGSAATMYNAINSGKSDYEIIKRFLDKHFGQGQSTGAAAGVAGVLPDLSPQAVSNVNNYNNSKKTDNSNNSKQINQYNTVYTQQAEVDTGRMLRQAQYAFSW